MIKEFPNVVGLTKEEAKNIIEGCGQICKIYEIYSNTVEKGKVISINNDEYIVGKFNAFELHVSKGPDTRIEIPRVANNWIKTEAEAIDI